jgi:phthiocerol/phenolphthiocerol synthesis type-I polyketide synthase E
MDYSTQQSGFEIAVMGMAGRFPGAADTEAFWLNLKNGVESVSTFTKEELLREGIPASLVDHDSYVPARGVLDGAEMFDAPFFGYYPREAQMLDPQHRVLLECAWQALEDAAYTPNRDELCGVFAGAGINNYGIYAAADPSIAASAQEFQIHLASSPHLLATRVSYKLNLRGPSFTVLTGCSTSLVAVHLACQSLWQGESDVALAGGVRIAFPTRSGHLYIPGGALSPDGHCRPFCADAQGTFGSDGVGLVVLRRLEDALAAGDRIRAVIKGSAINNDGDDKIGFTAPSVKGQAAVIRTALTVAGVEPQTIDYVETHGTGTPLGDPIEVAALKRAFGSDPTHAGRCALGSVKSNIGHADAAAGVIGIIKAVLALENAALPPSINFRDLNPEIDLQGTPFYVNTELRPWSRAGHPRRAGVSSFGIGGTNAHVVLEEAPPPSPTSRPRPWQILTLSAKTPSALEAAARGMEEYLGRRPEASLADVAYTLHVGRTAFKHRMAVVGRDAADACERLRKRDPERLRSGAAHQESAAPVAFLFPGGGAQYVGMGQGLYDSEPVFRRELDACAELLLPRLGCDIRALLYPPSVLTADAADIDAPAPMLASVFAISYALARLWMSWGVRPRAMLGHSLGEYVAACLSGVFTLEDALTLVTRRGRLFERLQPGAMLAVALPETQVKELLPPDVSLAAVNNPNTCVASGLPRAVEEFEARLAAEGVWFRRLNIAVAGHSETVEPILPDFARAVREVSLRPPQIPYISCITGTWITPEQATDPDYWVKHLRVTVRFGEGVSRLLEDEQRVLLEVGPGHTLTSHARSSEGWKRTHLAVTSLRHSDESIEDEVFLLSALGRLWASGVEVDWRGLHAGEERNRVGLPTYPFERRRYTVRPRPLSAATGEHPAEADLPYAEQYAYDGLGEGAAESTSSLLPEDRPATKSPRNENERRLVAIWEELFGIAPIGVDDDFFALGGHSLLATRFVFLLQKHWGIKNFSLRSLYRSPTIEQLAEIIVGTQEVVCEPTPDVREMFEDARLPPDIVYAAAGDSEAPGTPTVLLTGATGYLGGHILAELMEQTPNTVLCLARGRDEQDALARIRANLAAYGRWDERMLPRIVPVLGDLKLPLLGLDAGRFKELARRVGAIYHCGAEVHFTYPYSVLRDANVTGTRELIRLACVGCRKTLHHVSTLAVYSLTHYNRSEVFEESDTGPVEALTTGYAQSKWVAERAVVEARRLGVPAVIYRAGAVLGDSRSAVSRPGDAVWRVLKAAIETGKEPELDSGIPAAPADYVSGAVVRLSLDPRSAGRNFHVVAPEPLMWRDIFDAARAAGFSLEPVPYSDWYAQLLEQAERSEDGALYPLIHTFERDRLQYSRFDCSDTARALEGWAAAPAPIGRELLKRYIENFIGCGFLSRPSSASQAGEVVEANNRR